ncbi:TPA: RHS repeat-associated core domain-containing protein [Candidatus Poribacteria bacterium]|nr:RHS repeat-associated core domain-containing protein [Candidatus Poribacteria bacterium]
MFVIFGLPLFIVVLVSTRGFRSSGFKKHPIKSVVLVVVCLVCLIEFSPYPILLLDGTNPVDDRLIAKNLQRILTNLYGKGKIPISEIDKRFFDKQEKAGKQKEKWRGKIHLAFGPRTASANVLERDTLYFHTDQLGSTRLVTREDGTPYQYLNYMPFGKILEGEIIGPELPTWAAFKNSYTGQEYDKSTGLYFYQSRFYDADIGRFISADTVIPQPADGQTFNRYTYVNNNPFKFTDPTGHNAIVSFLVAFVEAIVIAVAFVVGTIIGGPALGLLLGMLVAGAISAIHAAIAGATGQEIMSAFVQGAVMAGVSSSNIVIGIIMTGVGIYQAAASNNPDAMAACVGGLVGGLFASTQSFQARISSQAKGLFNEAYSYVKNTIDMWRARADATPIASKENTDALTSFNETIDRMGKIADRTPWKYDDKIVAILSSVNVKIYPDKYGAIDAFYDWKTNTLYLPKDATSNSIILFHEATHAFLYNNYGMKHTEALALTAEKKWANLESIYHWIDRIDPRAISSSLTDMNAYKANYPERISEFNKYLGDFSLFSE